MAGESTPTGSERSNSETPISAERALPADHVNIRVLKGTAMVQPGLPGQPLIIDYSAAAPTMSDSTALVAKPVDSLKKKKRKLALLALNSVPSVRFADSNSPPVVDPRSRAQPTSSKNRKLKNNSLLQDTLMSSEDAPPGTVSPAPETVVQVPQTTDPLRDDSAILSEAAMDPGNGMDTLSEPVEHVAAPVISPELRVQLRQMILDGSIGSVLESPMPAAKRHMPPPAARTPSTPVAPVVVMDDDSPGEIPASAVAGPSRTCEIVVAMRASGQVDHELSDAIQNAIKATTPPGWPPRDKMVTMSLNELYSYWRNANVATMTLLYKEISVKAAFTDQKLPTSMANQWMRLYVDWRQAKIEAAVLSLDEVITLDNLVAFWNQVMCPDEVLPALMVYRAGDDEDIPQWPRITKEAILEVFPNLENAGSNQVQHTLLDLMGKNHGFQSLLKEAWDDFQRLRSCLQLVQVSDLSLQPELRLESDRWVPGTAWTRPSTKAVTIKSGVVIASVRRGLEIESL